MGYEVVEIQPTPNPNAIKFVLDDAIVVEPVSFLTPEAATDHSLASQLFAVKGVSSLLFLGNFVTVNKHPKARWEKINAQVREILKNA